MLLNLLTNLSYHDPLPKLNIVLNVEVKLLCHECHGRCDNIHGFSWSGPAWKSQQSTLDNHDPMQICLILSTRTFPRNKEVKGHACLVQDSHLHHMKLSDLRTVSVEHPSHDSHMVVLHLMNKNRISLMVSEHMECELFFFLFGQRTAYHQDWKLRLEMLEPFFGHPNEYVLLQLWMPRYGQTRIRSVSLWLLRYCAQPNCMLQLSA